MARVLYTVQALGLATCHEARRHSSEALQIHFSRPLSDDRNVTDSAAQGSVHDLSRSPATSICIGIVEKLRAQGLFGRAPPRTFCQRCVVIGRADTVAGRRFKSAHASLAPPTISIHAAVALTCMTAVCPTSQRCGVGRKDLFRWKARKWSPRSRNTLQCLAESR